MRIGVISDTHDKSPTIDKALAYFAAEKAALVVHCGDWKSLSTVEYFAGIAAGYGLPVCGVLGNNDLEREAFMRYADDALGNFRLFEDVYEVTLEDGTHLAAYHGHHQPTLRRLITDDTLDVLMLGHTHKPLVVQESGRLIVNPGSTAFAIPRSKSWLPSVAVVDTVKPQAEIKYLS